MYDIFRWMLHRKVYIGSDSPLFMAWTLLKQGNYLLRLTDGYMSEQHGRVSPNRDTEDPPQLRIASELYRRATQSFDKSEKIGMKRPSPIDIWIVGSNGWLDAQLPEPMYSLANGEKSTDYRMMIIGEGLQHVPHVSGWNNWVRSVGMKKKRRHENLKDFRDSANQLLRMMHDYRIWSVGCPSNALKRLNVPVTYVGDSG